MFLTGFVGFTHFDCQELQLYISKRCAVDFDLKLHFHSYPPPRTKHKRMFSK